MKTVILSWLQNACKDDYVHVHAARQSKASRSDLAVSYRWYTWDQSEADTTQNCIFGQQKKIVTESKADEATPQLLSLSRMNHYKPCSSYVQNRTAAAHKLLYLFNSRAIQAVAESGLYRNGLQSSQTGPWILHCIRPSRHCLNAYWCSSSTVDVSHQQYWKVQSHVLAFVLNGTPVITVWHTNNI